jgi:translocation and assembly module TamA
MVCGALALAPAMASQPAAAAGFFGLFGSEDRPPAPTATTLPYDVTFKSAEGKTKELLQGASDLYRLRTDAPQSSEVLVRRVAADLPRLIDALWAEGYYDASLSASVAGAPITLDGGGLDAAARAAERLQGRALVPVVIDVRPGPQFTLRHLRILDARTDLPLPATLVDAAALKYGPGDPLVAASVRALQARITDLLRARSHALAQVTDIEPVVHHDLDLVDVTIRVDPGPEAGLGPVTISGAKTVDPRVLRSFVYLEEGEAYSPDRIAALRKSLGQVEIVGSVRVLESDRLDASGNLPLEAAISERKPHLVSAAAQYSTVDGPSVRAAWTHRNLFGGGERLRLEATVGLSSENGGKPSLNLLDPQRLIGRVGASFIKPALWGSRNDLLADLFLVREVTPGYTSAFLNLTTGIRHRFGESLYVQAGLEAERGTSSDPFGSTDYTLVGVPVSLRYDTTDNPLDPTRGIRFIASTAAYAKALGSSLDLIQSKLQASTYYALDSDARYIVAGRVALGSLSGASISEIPDSRRFFAGGGGSVRGFAYRSLSPLGPGNVPIGGKSLFEASLEARIRLTETIGIVPFLDVGSAFASSYPDFRNSLRYAAGLGLRYYTGFGPLRLDLAVPLDRRKGEAPAAFYVSVGQAF